MRCTPAYVARFIPLKSNKHMFSFSRIITNSVSFYEKAELFHKLCSSLTYHLFKWRRLIVNTCCSLHCHYNLLIQVLCYSRFIESVVVMFRFSQQYYTMFNVLLVYYYYYVPNTIIICYIYILLCFII